MSDKMSLVLRELCQGNASGEGPVEVMTRVEDFNVVTVQNQQGQPMRAPARSLIVFTAMAFRELGDKSGKASFQSGVWEFRVEAPTKPGSAPTMARLFVAGEDILTIRAPSAIA